MISFKSTLGYSAIESIGSRIFDFAVLWIVLNSLPEADIAKFGIATASIFFFNLIFFGPETALLRKQKEWANSGQLPSYLSAFISFSAIKLFIHLGLALVAVIFFGADHWLIYSVIFSAITQQIQLAEIARIYMRMELQQKAVARFELASKAVLCGACLWLFEVGSLKVYFLIYFIWGLVAWVLWLYKLKQRQPLRFEGARKSVALIWDASIGFSFWTHISGVLTYYIYNANVLYLGLFDASAADIALYTVISKVMNLFFVIPMFFQSFVPIILSNAGDQSSVKFKKLLLSNAVFSLLQFIFFVLLGWWLAPFFGLEDVTKTWDFYYLGVIISGGILVLNLSRPLSTYLLIRSSPQKVMLLIFIPSALLASILYTAGSYYSGILGCAIGSAIAYLFMAIMLYSMYLKNRRLLAANVGF